MNHLKSILEYYIIIQNSNQNQPTVFSSAERKYFSQPYDMDLFNFLALASQRRSSSPSQMAALHKNRRHTC
ncbi:hypothetical protein Hanom_Chr02g00141651 [Helianthus anomalus]